jgi:hypothetical protein
MTDHIGDCNELGIATSGSILSVLGLLTDRNDDSRPLVMQRAVDCFQDGLRQTLRQPFAGNPLTSEPLAFSFVTVERVEMLGERSSLKRRTIE